MWKSGRTPGIPSRFVCLASKSFGNAERDCRSRQNPNPNLFDDFMSEEVHMSRFTDRELCDKF